jgi:hypothetical protein
MKTHCLLLQHPCTGGVMAGLSRFGVHTGSAAWECLAVDLALSPALTIDLPQHGSVDRLAAGSR